MNNHQINKIIHYDHVSVHDVIKSSVQYNSKLQSPIRGLVRIFVNGLLNTDQTEDGWLKNMTIASGREFVAQSIYKKNIASSRFGSIYNFKLDSFGVGSGGSSIDADTNVTLAGPELCDIGLYRPVKLNSNCLSAMNNDGVIVSNIVKKI